MKNIIILIALFAIIGTSSAVDFAEIVYPKDGTTYHSGEEIHIRTKITDITANTTMVNGKLALTDIGEIHGRSYLNGKPVASRFSIKEPGTYELVFRVTDSFDNSYAFDRITFTVI